MSPLMRRQATPPPMAFTFSDRLRLALGAMMLLLGVVLLWRTLPVAFSWQAILVSVAFIGFGAQRLWLGYTRLQQWRAIDRRER